MIGHPIPRRPEVQEGKSAVDQIVRDIASPDIKTKIVAIEQAATIVGRLAAAAVEALEAEPSRFLVAERLHRFGPTIIPYLQDLLSTTRVAEAKTLAALVLLQLEDQSGIPTLLTTVEEDTLYAGLCANHLASANITEAEAPILARLERTPLEEVDLLVSLILALKTMNRQLPDSLVSRFNAESAPWQVRTLLRE